MNLEQHWQSIYHQKEPIQVSWYQPYPSMSMEMIRSTKASPNASIIDVGGGSSLFVDALLYSEYKDVSVLDISSAALEHSKQRLGSRASQVQWLTSDVLQFEPPKIYDVWHDRAVFHFLIHPEDSERYIQLLKKALRSQGHFILATFATDGPNKCSGFPVEQYDEDKIQRVLGPDFQWMQTKQESHVTPSGVEQKFIYFHFQYIPVS